MERNFIGWLERVCDCIRFQPDRKAIRKELWAHYEDHCRDLERLEYEPALARQRALEAMGDPLEVGKALDLVHKPWLGWLWEASRILLLVLTVLSLLTLFRTAGVSQLTERLQVELEKMPEMAARVELEHGTLYAAPGNVTEWDGHYVAELKLWVRMRERLGTDHNVITYLFAYQDGQGELPLYEMDDRTRTTPEVRYWRYKSRAAGWTQCHQTVELVLEEPPQWVEISYPLSGEDWALRLEWEGTE